MSYRSTLCLVGVVVFCGTAHAQPPATTSTLLGGAAAPPAEWIDLNKDGRITQDERDLYLKHHPNKIPLPNRRPKRGVPLGEVDANRDGLISRQELATAWTKEDARAQKQQNKGQAASTAGHLTPQSRHDPRHN